MSLHHTTMHQITRITRFGHKLVEVVQDKIGWNSVWEGWRQGHVRGDGEICSAAAAGICEKQMGVLADSQIHASWSTWSTDPMLGYHRRIGEELMARACASLSFYHNKNYFSFTKNIELNGFGDVFHNPKHRASYGFEYRKPSASLNQPIRCIDRNCLQMFLHWQIYWKFPIWSAPWVQVRD